MSITDPHVLPGDVMLLAVSELDPETRAKLDCDEDAFAVTRPRSRTPAKIVEARAGELLLRFKSAKTIADAVLEVSTLRGIDPEQLLVDAYPMLQRFVSAGLLVEEGSERATDILPSMDVGHSVAGWRVVRCVQVLEDVELYQVRDAADRTGALKIGRYESHQLRASLEREAHLLHQLDGDIAPRLFDHGQHEGRPYAILEWCSGVNLAAAAEELRASSALDASSRLLRLCVAIAEAYAKLHARGVVHGDVHERNVLVDAAGRLTILDLGLARRIGAAEYSGEVPRGGVGIYFEPEYVGRDPGAPRPPATPMGELYALGALLYGIFTGRSYLNFSLDRVKAMRQIVEEAPLTFAQRGVAPFPELEAVLFKALEKSPDRRHASVAIFAVELKRVAESRESRQARVPNWTRDAAGDALLDATLTQLMMGGQVFESGVVRAPTANVNFGAAGIAHALYRIALAREDATLLAHADIWGTRAAQAIGSPRAFYNPAFGLSRATIGTTSLYHTAGGVHAVRALIARAMGDLVGMQSSIESFVVATGRQGEYMDVTLGRAGILLGASLLMEAVLRDTILEPATLRAHGDRIARGLQMRLQRAPPVGRRSRPLNLGVAHGWAGVLLALLRWQSATNAAADSNVERRLAELAAWAEPEGRGLRWPWFVGGLNGPRDRGYMSGWCNGSAGYVHLWLEAYETLGESRFLELARGAAWNAWEDEYEDSADLCCGMSGRAYALLAMHRVTGDPEWLSRTQSVAWKASRALDDPIAHARQGISLYKSSLGLAVLLADLDRPESGRMPAFEREGWPKQGDADTQHEGA